MPDQREIKREFENQRRAVRKTAKSETEEGGEKGGLAEIAGGTASKLLKKHKWKVILSSLSCCFTSIIWIIPPLALLIIVLYAWSSVESVFVSIFEGLGDFWDLIKGE